MTRNNSFSPERKDRIKAVRSVIQFFILLAAVILLIRLFFYAPTYEPVTEDQRMQTDQGFITLSYFGVDRSDVNNLIDTKLLDEHLKALEASGYQTITQQDIIDYYTKGTALPEKALFLIFEDGRRDTAIFAQNIMEKYNFKATISNYAQNLSINDPKFLDGSDLIELEKSTFWEIGSNGYRLAYINVFDRYNHFLDVLTTYEFQEVKPYLERDYNHYLMDYIRDENNIPKENLQEMADRIQNEYQLMEDDYMTYLGEIPAMYVLMHSNTGQFGTNDKVSIENAKYIKELFSMNFNREGDSFNLLNSSIYDLTRMQPQAYWSTNHLLMRIQDDTGQELAFVSGDEERKANWEVVQGEAEFKEDTIILTSLPDEEGIMTLKEGVVTDSFTMSVNLEGNKLGEQSVYLGYDRDTKNAVKVSIKNNVLEIYDAGNSQPLFELDLDVHDELEKDSIDQDKVKAEIAKLRVDLDYAVTTQEQDAINQEIRELQSQTVTSTEEGAPAYTPTIDHSDPGHRQLKLQVENNQLTVWIDGKVAAQDLAISDVTSGAIALEAKAETGGYSQRNLYDDVYDGVFSQLVVSDSLEDFEDEEAIIYDNRLHGWDWFKHQVRIRWNTLIDWFVNTL